MPESYSSFYGREPSIDVNLFVNALTQGIAAGNAQLTRSQAVFEGISEGLSGGIKTAQGIQQIRANAANLEVAEDPAVIAAKKQQAITAGQVAQQAGEILQKTASVDQDTAVLTSQAKNDQATIAANDSAALSRLVQLGSAGNTADSIAALGDPNVQQALSRNPVFGQQYVNALRQQGGDPALLDPLQRQYENLAYQTQKNRAANRLGEFAAKEALKNEALAGQFQSRLDTTPEADRYTKADNFDYRLLDIRPSKVKTAQGTPVGYDITYGEQVVKPSAYTRDEVKEGRKALDAYKSNFYQAAGNPPLSLTQPQKPPVTPGGLTVESLHNRRAPGTITETDLLRPSTTGITSPTAAEPFLDGAVKLGGFSTDVVTSNKKVFRDLNNTINSVIKSGDIYSDANRTILQESINHTARSISNYTFDSSPAVRASVTQVQVEQHNSNIDRMVPEGAINQSLKVSNPKELYYMNTGDGLVKQVTRFTNKAIKAKQQIRTLQEAKAKSNTNQLGVLREIASGAQ